MDTPPTPQSRVVPADSASTASRIQGGSILLFRVAGIDVLLHWSWIFFAVLRLQPGNGDDALQFAPYDAQLWNVAEYVMLFGFVLLHEFGHVLACRSVGGTANRIVIWPLGGIALIDPPARPGAVLWSIAAGPLVNALLLVPTTGIWLLCRAAGCQEGAPDLYRFAGALAWINGYLLLFNLLPVFPLDGGRILQSLLWFIMGRARSLLVAAAVSLLTTLGLLTVAIVERSLPWGIVAGFGVLFSLIGVQGARGLSRMLAAPRRTSAACPDCGAAPPTGNWWACTRCWTPFDVFATGGNCPNCSNPLAMVLCPECGRSLPYNEWYPDSTPVAPVTATATDAAPKPDRPAGHTVTVTQRVVWSLIFTVFALFLCALPNIDQQPLAGIVWTAGAAVLGATTAGPLTRAWRTGQARKRLRGTWRLVETDGVPIADGTEQAHLLVLNYTAYEERVGNQRDANGTCWTDPLANPPAISFTPKSGPDAGTPRQGSYRLDADRLTVCLAHAAQPRPTTFAAQPDIQQLRIYRRSTKANP
jgi:uncharacterized protein (TIGR03067 family)